MKYAASAAMLIVLILAGAAVWAQCPVVCPQPVMVQPACPTVCPQPCEQPCPPPCPTPCPQICCPASVPAAVGAGPQDQLMGLACPEFDPNYAKSAYQQNATIIAVTQSGMQRASNHNLRAISGEINRQLIAANQKLVGIFASCACLTADQAQAEAIVAELCAATGACYDVTYAKTLSALLKQSQATDELVTTRSSNAQLLQHSQFMNVKNSGWVFRLDRWVAENGVQ